MTNDDSREVWFLTGSQGLYGPETLEQVAEQSRVHRRVQRLEPAGQALRKPGQLLHRGDRDSGGPDRGRGRPGGDQLYAGRLELRDPRGPLPSALASASLSPGPDIERIRMASRIERTEVRSLAGAAYRASSADNIAK